MRFVTGFLTCLTVGGLSQAWASDPEPQPAAVTPAQQPSKPAEQSKTTANPTSPLTSTSLGPSSVAPATTPSNQAAAAPSTTPGAAPSQSQRPPELTAQEKNLIAHGYKLEVRNGQNYLCRTETPVGTRIPSKICATAEMRATLTQDSQDLTRQVQRAGMDPTLH